MMESSSSPVDGISLHKIQANGITHRVASTRNLEDHADSPHKETKLPLIMFLHGWPESWFSWRHQLTLLKSLPYLAIAPDMRGYGSTSKPANVEDYTVDKLANDVIGIANILGYASFILVGHDHGAALAWNIAMLYPKHIQAVCCMSVPFCGLGKCGFLTMLQQNFGKCLNATRHEKLQSRFNYILHHNLPRVEEEYDKDAREALYRIYTYQRRSSDSDTNDEYVRGTPEFDPHGPMFPPTGNDQHDAARPLDATNAPGLWLRIPKPISLPSWLPLQDFEYYVSEFQRSGFLGGLRWYQVLDRNWNILTTKLGRNPKVLQPSMFLMGQDDGVMQMYGGKESLSYRMQQHCTNLICPPLFIKGAGHWVQQQYPKEVNQKLLEFLERVTHDNVDSSTTTTTSFLTSKI